MKSNLFLFYDDYFFPFRFRLFLLLLLLLMVSTLPDCIVWIFVSVLCLCCFVVLLSDGVWCLDQALESGFFTCIAILVQVIQNQTVPGKYWPLKLFSFAQFKLENVYLIGSRQQTYAHRICTPHESNAYMIMEIIIKSYDDDACTSTNSLLCLCLRIKSDNIKFNRIHCSVDFVMEIKRRQNKNGTQHTQIYNKINL